MKIIFVRALIVCGCVTSVKANDVCLNETEYDFYMLGNLVKDVEKRIQSLRENVKEVIKTRCPDSSCGDEWVSFNNSCYFFENIKSATFEEARQYCKQKAANLLYVEDDTENSFIVKMLGRFKSNNNWLNGLTDQSTEGNWKWIDTNVPARFIKWAPNEPQGRTRENCVAYIGTNYYRWHDITCSSKCPFICKKRKISLNVE
ncbi:macrophage mannose receptor 1-like isoform X2 [Ruditapes philippinarum]|uniref:macrophage mannose receptor 1-like isoform X2 n=1 Tax=Ruditapes philippinarum TaxID=129788 RepID=UPI00295B0575|nr:macrophage mannose receptor 1-like isoform X2 [Ruditapes philippinarum]